MTDQRLGGLFALGAYGLPIVTYLIARAMAGPATGGPTPPDAGDVIAIVGLIGGLLCGFMAFVFGQRTQSGGLKLLGGLALAISALVLLLSLFGPTFA